MKARHCHTPSLLLVFVFLLSFLTARSSFAWFCEGRMCGVKAWYCCCASPDGPVRDPRCATGERSFSEKDAGKTSLCVAGCRCTMAAIGAYEEPPSGIVTTPHLVTPFFAVLLEPVRLPTPTPVLVGSSSRFVEARGPPSLASCFPAHTLRGPPYAGNPLVRL